MKICIVYINIKSVKMKTGQFIRWRCRRKIPTVFPKEAVYTVTLLKNIIKKFPGLRLKDGARRIFINTMGENREEFSKEFLDFMEDINASTDEVAAQSESEKIQRIHEKVRWIKASEKIGVKLMQRWEELANAREEGREIGWNQGRETGRRDTYVEMVKKGLISVTDAANQLKVSEADICAMLE